MRNRRCFERGGHVLYKNRMYMIIDMGVIDEVDANKRTWVANEIIDTHFFCHGETIINCKKLEEQNVWRTYDMIWEGK